MAPTVPREDSAEAKRAKISDKVQAMGPGDREVVYANVVRVAELFFDWRHKVMTFTFTVTSGLLALAAWMYDHDLQRALAAPLFLASLLAAASAVFERRNQQLLSGCYDLAEGLETVAGLPPDLGPLGRIPIRQDRSLIERLMTYHSILGLIYWTLFFVFLGAAIAVLVAPQSPH